MRVLLLSLFLTGCMNWNGLPELYRTDLPEVSHDGGNVAQVDGGTVSEEDGATLPHDDDGGIPVDGAITVDGTVVSVPDMACSPQYTHSNGLGATWTDCVPLGTYNNAQALKACEASYGAACHNESTNGGCYELGVFEATTQLTWVFFNSFAGEVITGDCLTPGTEKAWN